MRKLFQRLSTEKFHLKFATFRWVFTRFGLAGSWHHVGQDNTRRQTQHLATNNKLLLLQLLAAAGATAAAVVVVTVVSCWLPQTTLQQIRQQVVAARAPPDIKFQLWTGDSTAIATLTGGSTRWCAPGGGQGHEGWKLREANRNCFKVS